ncbi:TPA: competence type IV pilus minor pilin ComGF [Streptococcus agalactiae]
MKPITNKGKSFLRAEVSEKQKEYISLLADIRGVTTQELLGQVVERFIECLVALVTITGALLVYQGLTKLLAQQIVVMSSSSQSEWVLLTQQLNAEFEGAHLEYLRQNKLYLRKQDKIVTFGKSNKDDFRKTGYDGRGYQPMVYGLDNCQMSQTKSMVKLVFYFKDGLKRTFYYDFKEET